MATRKIRLDGDDVLRKVCKPIEKMTPRLQTLIDDMYEKMYEANILEIGGEEVSMEEGCLSLPGLQGTVTRPNHVICEAYDEDMQLRQIEGEGLLARAICHEC